MPPRRPAPRAHSTRFVVAALTVLVGVATGSAQETRAGAIASAQAEKAARLAPYRPSRFELVMGRLEQNFVDPPNGIYPVVARVYSGGGFSAGLAYRRFVERQAMWEVLGLYSVKHYKLVEAGVQTPWNGQGRWSLGGRAGWLDAPQVGYFGVGPTTRAADRANFRLTERFAEATAIARPARWFRLAGEVAIELYRLGRGRGRFPSIETRFDAASAPGLDDDPTYVRTEVTAAADRRPAPGYARRGGLYALSLVQWAGRADTRGFRRLHAELVQHVPILRETWVISLRGRLETTIDGAEATPYFLLPALGSGRTLRGYSTGRFRDRHAVLTSAEFRWIPNRLAFDMALFYDTGTVAASRRALRADRFVGNWGVGARFHGPTATVLRIEAARGADGWNLVVATSAPF